LVTGRARSGSGAADPAIRWSGRDWVPGERLSGRAAEEELPADAPVVGVLALQGDVLEHLRALRRCGARPVRVRRAEDLDDLDGLIIPGGESTTIGKLLDRSELLSPLRDRIEAGLPTLGTCAGMILLSRELDQDRVQPLLGVLGVRTRRNAFGRQIDSFDTALDIAGIDGGPVDVSFIRAPWVEQVLDDDVEVLADVDGKPVVVRQGHVLAAAFHPEVTGDDRLHQRFVDLVRAPRAGA
jgi:5'-phosphate synthase pdxT subunit